MKVLTIISILVFSSLGFSHSRIVPDGKLKPRSLSPGIKVAPCGEAGFKANPKAKRVTLKAGDKLLVQWEEPIQHPGYFRISFSTMADKEFELNVLADKIPHVDNLENYQKEVTVPNINCNNCTIQLAQYMEDQDAFYYSCADVKIKDAKLAAK